MYSRLNVCFTIFTAVSLLALLGLALCSCNKKEPVRIGFVGGLSGRVADLGVAGRNGAILAIEERNSMHGIQGRTIELLVEDDRQDPEVARAAVHRLIDQEVSAIIGHMTSAMSAATVPLVNAKKVVMVSPTTTTDQLSGINDYFFRVIDSTRDYAFHGAEYFYKKQQIKKISAIYDLGNEAFTGSYLNNFRIPFEKMGGNIVKTETFRSGTDISFFSLVEEALSSKPEGILLITNAFDAALICQQIHKLRPNIPVITSEWSATEQFINLGGKAVEGVFAHQYFDRDSNEPNYLAFRKTYIARFDEEPGFASVGGYDAANVILDALEQQKKGKSLKETIQSITDFEGLQEKITIDPFGDTSRVTRLSVVRDGKFVTLD